MYRVLFVVASYRPMASANGVCIEHIKKALNEMGVYVDILTQGQRDGIQKRNIDGCVFTIKTKNGGRIASPESIVGVEHVIRFFQKCVLAISWPVKSPLLYLKYRRMIHRLSKQNQYDAIVGVLLPIEGALACSHFRPYLVYELDSITNNPDNLYGAKRLLSHRAYRIEEIMYQIATAIFHLNCHKEFYENKRYDSARNKFRFVDIPMLERSSTPESCRYPHNKTGKISLLYSGTLIRAYRSPQYLINLCTAMNEHIELQCDFYSHGDCEQTVMNAEKSTNGTIKACGYVDVDTINQKTSEADVLVSIGNSFDGTVTSIPSKIFSYMATGKPIIHIMGNNNDTAIECLRKYPEALLLDQNDDFYNNVHITIEFIRRNVHKQVDYSLVVSLFPENTPEYTAKRIVEAIKDASAEKSC